MILKPRPFRKPNLGHPLAKGLVGYWLMNEGTGDVVQDLSGNGNTGVITGAVWDGGKFGSCLKFVNDTDTVTITTKGFNTSAGTISMWANPSGFAANTYLFSHYNSGNRIYIYSSATGSLFVRMGSTTAADTGKDLVLFKWSHIALSWDGTNYYVYLDGLLIYTNTYADLTTLTTVAYISILNGVNQAWQGKVDLPMVYNRALSASEVQQLYREPLHTFERDDFALWTGAMGGEMPSVYDSIFFGCNF